MVHRELSPVMPTVTARHALSAPRIYSSPRPPPRDPSFARILYDNSAHYRLSFDSPSASSTMFSYVPHTNSWHSDPPVHLFPSNPYPTPPPPHPIPHKVWILDCKSCGTFLTNRGMKAVLLLRPNVSLYSSDALPINCSAYNSDTDSQRRKPTCRQPSSPHPGRTCECLTQTLSCHGCGSPVGYMIVIPCLRCTSSISATNRATNGHRFVFHASEVTGTERHYIADEPGVIPFEPTAIVMSHSTVLHPTTSPLAYSPPYADYSETHTDEHYQDHLSYSPRPSPSPRSEYLPTPPLEFADPVLASAASIHHTSSYTDAGILHHASPFSQRYHVRPPHHDVHSPSSDIMDSPSTTDPSPAPADQKEQPAPRTLKSGDVIFWHHLARSGEIPGVVDNEKARRPDIAAEKKAAPMVFNR